MATSSANETFLQLVSRGNAIVAEIKRMRGYIPREFQWHPTKDKKQAHALLLVDYQFFQTPNVFDQRWHSDPMLLALDERLKEKYLTLIERFYALFESVLNYHRDLIKLTKDLDGGIFVQESIETLLADHESSQILAESLFLLGVILLQLDLSIDGVVRERLLVAYARWTGLKEGRIMFEDVKAICARIGPSEMRIELLFSRLPLPEQLVQVVTGKIRSESIYGQNVHFPLPEHRSVALLNEGALIVVLLFFQPDILRSDNAKMREIVDKHFPDNWVITFNMGTCLDLSTVWNKYPSAKMALEDTLSREHVRKLIQTHLSVIQDRHKELTEYLSEGFLTDAYVLENVKRLITCLRACNVSLRWLLLHWHGSQKPLAELVKAAVQAQRTSLTTFMIDLAQFEFQFKHTLNRLLSQKSGFWQDYKKEGYERMLELAEFFSGDKPLTRVVKDPSLQNWFQNMWKQIQSLNYDDARAAGRRIVQLVRALEEIEQFHQLESNVHILHFLEDTRKYLGQMLQLLNVKGESNVTLSVVTDFSYVWQFLEEYISEMQFLVKENPKIVVKLRALFFKLTSVMDLPLLRISQANSPDLVSVSQFYSGQLVEFIRKVLQIIPATLFEILDRVIDIQTNNFTDLPSKADRQMIQNFSRLDYRYNLAQAVYGISLFTQGIMAMETTLVGVIELDPREVLETGIRKELSTRIASQIKSSIQFSGKGLILPGLPATTELEEKLHRLFNLLRGTNRSMELVQDYLCVSASRLWREEYRGLIQKYSDYEYDKYRVYPTDLTAPTSFMGRIASELLRLSDPVTTVYDDDARQWSDKKSQVPIISARTARHLCLTLSPFGGRCLMKVFGFHTIFALRCLESALLKIFTSPQSGDIILNEMEKRLFPTAALPPSFSMAYMKIVAAPYVSEFTNVASEICRIGQLQLLQRQIQDALEMTEAVDAFHMHSALDTLEEAAMKDALEAFWEDEAKFTAMMGRKNGHVDSITMFSQLNCETVPDPLMLVYPVPFDDLLHDHFALILFLVAFAILPRFSVNSGHGVLVIKSRSDVLDPHTLIAGVVTVLRQFETSHSELFFALLDQYVRTCLNAVGTSWRPPLDHITCAAFSQMLMAASPLLGRIGSRFGCLKCL